MKENVMKLDLALFGEDTGAGTAAGEEAAASEVVYGKQAKTDKAEASKGEPEEAAKEQAKSKSALKAEFEKLIKGEYKEVYDERVQTRIRERFKQTKSLEEKVASLNPLADALAMRYGLDAADTKALLQALEADDQYLENAAYEQGLTKEQLIRQRMLERENAQYKRAMEEQRRRDSANEVYKRWNQQAEAAASVYEGLSLDAELMHPETGERFAALLRSGVDVRTAYEVIHKDEIIGGVMKYTAQKVQEQTINDVRARGLRPAEAGSSGNGASRVVKSDPKTFTKKDRDEIARRVMRGERIEL